VVQDCRYLLGKEYLPWEGNLKMLPACSCFNRLCKYYEGVEESNNLERSPKHICRAFPNGIPDEITAGRDEHSRPLARQLNNIVYEGASSYAEVEMFKSKRGF
jgi:hypothetical protein